MIDFKFPDRASAAAQQAKCELQRVLTMCAPLVLPPPDGHKPGDAPNADVQRAYELANKGLTQLRAGDVAGATRTALTANRIFMNGFTHLLEPIADKDLRNRKAQSVRAQKDRSSEDVDRIIERLAGVDDSVKALWNVFPSELDAASVKVKLHEDDGDVQNWFIEYEDTNGKSGKMKFNTFKNEIGKARRKQKAQ